MSWICLNQLGVSLALEMVSCLGLSGLPLPGGTPLETILASSAQSCSQPQGGLERRLSLQQSSSVLKRARVPSRGH